MQSDGIHTKPLDITLCPWKSRPLEVVDCHHPWWLTTVKDWNLQGQHFSSLADVCKKSTSMTEPLEFVKQALYLLPRLDLSNDTDIVFAKDQSLTKGERTLVKEEKFWTKDIFWTSGVSARTCAVLEKYPGQNHFGSLLKSVQLAKPMEEEES